MKTKKIKIILGAGTENGGIEARFKGPDKPAEHWPCHKVGDCEESLADALVASQRAVYV